ncbi:DedA family protein [Campylobacter upsaliensis]|uniref:DedA family protein n=5 Tax=Campylobacter upsaliensis TaxID=28080 RepID=A0A5L4LNS9_CAMUP|nr:DedA family protein [Campylobacter upsaliensis]EAH5879665.1 DedA family protein [Campylobacter upsaliensis]EAH5977993.1 DedA family protein [Campylobacter upsaliensis]EAH6868005.1 DedA family protein [Campylobacter upsaliensis]EAH9851494.1 DedA family protein [Campylobacter upsaliensis]
MKKSLKFFIFLALLCLIAYAIYGLMKNDFSLEEFIIGIWNDHVETWGYAILFCWSILEGELGLIFAGLAAHDGKMSVALAIFVAGLGGFVGDQIYFYIGRYNKNYIQKKLHSQRRKFAVAHLLLQKFGWPIIFIQRYMYGFRTIIPMSIGITRYSAKKFALINLISAWVWAAITILLAWYFGDLIQSFLKWAKDHWYLAALLIVSFLSLLLFGFKQMEKAILKKKERKK